MRRGGVAYFLVSGASAVALAQAAPAHADTLQEALTEAYLNNPSLLAARANQRATDENVQIQEAPGIPGVSASGNYIEFIKNSPNSFTAPDRRLQVGPELTVPVYSGGAIRNAVKAAEERVAAGQAELRATESAIFSRVVAAYMDVLRTQALVALSRNQVEFLTVNLQATSDRFEIGDLTRTDVAQSQSRLALARGDYRNAQANLINELLENRRISGVKAAAVDAFQGGERDAMVFSPVMARGMRPGTVAWASQENRVNVAVTRAREVLVVVADTGFCRAQDGIIKELVNYCTLVERIRKSSPAELKLFGLLVLENIQHRNYVVIADMEEEFVIDGRVRDVVVRVDGGQHFESRAADEARKATLAANGYQVIDFTGAEVLETPDYVLGEIRRTLDDQ